MYCIRRSFIALLTVLTLAPALAEGPSRAPLPAARTALACLDQKERRAANESGKIIPLAAAMRSAGKRIAGSVVRARLCRDADGLVYELTVLARDGRVARLTVDAQKGTVVGQR
jgi:hypothetical protein